MIIELISIYGKQQLSLHCVPLDIFLGPVFANWVAPLLARYLEFMYNDKHKRPIFHDVYRRDKITTTLSVIIPTLNEGAYLPGLLQALHAQTRQPDEIIVADAGSLDNTVQIAQRAGCLVMAGGRPARGRNAGAAIAKGDMFLFLDADVLPESHFIEKFLEEFIRMDCDLATCQTEPIEKNLTNSIVMGITNIYINTLQAVSPHAPGFCIMARREIHEATGGFNEALRMSEDHDYVQRGARHGKFKVLRHVHIPVSMRRSQKNGLVGWILVVIWCELYGLAGKPIYSIPFRYEDGAFAPPTFNNVVSRRAFDRGEFRKQISYLLYPFRRWRIIGQSQLGNLERDDWLEISRQRGIRLKNRLHFPFSRKGSAKRNKP